MNSKKENRMTYMADDELAEKVKEMRTKYQLNISAVIRDCLAEKYSELKKNEVKK